MVRVQSIDNMWTPQLLGRFGEVRAREYQQLIREIQEFFSMSSQKQSVGRLSRLRSRFQKIVEVDFFGSSLQKHVAELLSRADVTRVLKPAQPAPKIHRQDYKSRVWVTRPRPGIDRSASAWLIRRFVDAKARFTFASEDHVPRGAIPFDMFCESGFGHQGDECTFETLEKRFQIHNRKVAVIGQVIHDADLHDGKFGRKEGYGLDEVLKGWARQGMPDKELLERGMKLIEGLYHAL